MIKSITTLRLDEQSHLSARVEICHDSFFLHFFVLRIHIQIADHFTKTFLGIARNPPVTFRRHIFADPCVGIFMGACFLQLGQRQAGHQTYFISFFAIVTGQRLGATQQFRTFTLKNGVGVYVVYGRDIHIVRERSVTGKQPVQIVLDPGANPFGIVRLQHNRLGVAGAKVTSVR